MWSSLSTIWVSLQLNSSLIGWAHFVDIFFSLSEHVLLATQLARKPLGSICLCSPARLKVHTIVSGFYMHSGDPNLMQI